MLPPGILALPGVGTWQMLSARSEWESQGKGALTDRGLGSRLCQTLGRDKGPCLGDGCGQGLLELQRGDNCDKECGDAKNGERPTVVVLVSEW